ncbi:hypothetical protein DFP72DRAFT_1171682 [Ephemerocybe angulata]|uniref:Uncharacterized protein n=1 Tax=Ephemerocybe angulata TaxID=980116 RepID=A0A8H6HUE1_9AGAR|nr:hypothetical protein DFP72DRAFT_1171682 [Tulosesus angulatus]
MPNATGAAVEEGILPGGGLALLRATFQWLRRELGAVAIIPGAITNPARTIYKNAGEESSILLVSEYGVEGKPNWGYDAAPGFVYSIPIQGALFASSVTDLWVTFLPLDISPRRMNEPFSSAHLTSHVPLPSAFNASYFAADVNMPKVEFKKLLILVSQTKRCRPQDIFPVLEAPASPPSSQHRQEGRMPSRLRSLQAPGTS